MHTYAFVYSLTFCCQRQVYQDVYRCHLCFSSFSLMCFSSQVNLDHQMYSFSLEGLLFINWLRSFCLFPLHLVYCCCFPQVLQSHLMKVVFANQNDCLTPMVVHHLNVAAWKCSCALPWCTIQWYWANQSKKDLSLPRGLFCVGYQTEERLWTWESIPCHSQEFHVFKYIDIFPLCSSHHDAENGKVARECSIEAIKEEVKYIQLW